MQEMFFPQDVNQYKIFSVSGKYGVATWQNRLILNPICVSKPNIELLEDFGFTFIQTVDGQNIIDENGRILMKHFVYELAWISKGKIAVFQDKEGNEGLFFPKQQRYINNITNAEFKNGMIETNWGALKDLATMEGKEVFRPLYYAIVDFSHNMYIAYSNDKTAILNSPKWEKETPKAFEFKILKNGIMGKFHNEGYQWINPENGNLIPEEEQTYNQKKLLEFARKKEALITQK